MFLLKIIIINNQTKLISDVGVLLWGIIMIIVRVLLMRLLVQTFWASPRTIQLKNRASLATELTPLNIGSRVHEGG